MRDPTAFLASAGDIDGVIYPGAPAVPPSATVVVVDAGEAGRGLRALFEKVPLGVIVISQTGVVKWANGGALALVGRRAEELTGRPITAILHPDDWAAARERMGLLAATGASPPLRDFRIVRGDGDERLVEVTGSVVPFDGEPALVSMLRDVTQERRQRTLLDTILTNVDDGVTLLDEHQRCVYANRAHATIFARTPEQMLGLTPQGFMALAAPLLEDPEGLQNTLRLQTEDPTRTDDVFVFTRPHRRVMRRRAGPVLLPTGPGYLIVWRDVTVEHDRLVEGERQSTTDPLTGLYNRRGAESAAARERARADRTGAALSLAMFDIDHFKRVNDTHGHAAGDAVLRMVARELTALARLTDVVARWGGEEFVAILPGGADGARAYAERTRAAVAALELVVGSLTISAGVTELAPGEPFEVGLMRADARLYEAKRAGRNRVVG